MIEKVNPSHPDKVMDRIAGALVDLAYEKKESPKIAVEGMIGHGICNMIIETDVEFTADETDAIVSRIAGRNIRTEVIISPQDEHLADNQAKEFRCGDNGIFKGMPITDEERKLSKVARGLYEKFPYDGKYILNGDHLIVCQSNASIKELLDAVVPYKYPKVTINPLGEWTGGLSVDTGAVNRKLGSDMGHALTGGGWVGKDCSKADVSLTIYAFMKAQLTGEPVELCCAIGDDRVDGKPYGEIVDIALSYIKSRGGFEKMAEWGFF